MRALIAVPSTSNPLSITITPPSQSRLSVDWVPLLVRQRERSFSVLHAPRRKSPLLSESALTWQKQRRGVLSGKGSLGLMIFVIAYKQINTVCIPKLLKTDERIMTFVPDPTSSRWWRRSPPTRLTSSAETSHRNERSTNSERFCTAVGS